MRAAPPWFTRMRRESTDAAHLPALVSERVPCMRSSAPVQSHECVRMEMLVSMLDRDRERYRLEDRELEIKMAEQGIR